MEEREIDFSLKQKISVCFDELSVFQKNEINTCKDLKSLGDTLNKKLKQILDSFPKGVEITDGVFVEFQEKNLIEFNKPVKKSFLEDLQFDMNLMLSKHIEKYKDEK